jgi:WD40 repeat protein
VDAIRFVAAFTVVISQSAPHLYLSAVPFAPEQSKVAQQFLPHFPQTFSVNMGKAVHWPAFWAVLEGHSGTVNSVSFSHDGRRIVSGSDDCTIRIWDARTGVIVAGPFYGHTDKVLSVAFSHDSKRVVSGSRDRTVRVWDAETGAILLGPFRVHTSVAYVTISPDGKQIISGCPLWECIWNAETGVTVSDSYEGHSCYNLIRRETNNFDITRVVRHLEECRYENNRI